MTTIYCSSKLSILLGLPKQSKDILTEVDPYSWNAQLFYVNKRKCLLFMHKPTLYSFLALDIVKKDLADFPSFFRQGLTDQLLADQLLSPQTKSYLDLACASITLLQTDNDKRVLGSLNNHIQNIRFCDYREGDTLLMKSTYIAHQLNRTPMKPIGYRYPVEKMKQYLST
jgi:hypothetical protein